MTNPGTAHSPDRFQSLERLYSAEDYKRIRAMRVTIVGLGGVGSWTAEALARSGVASLRLIDMDDICTTNINRQIHALDCTVGQSKVSTLAKRIQHIHPDCLVEAIPLFLTPSNAMELLSSPAHCVVDATDRMSVKAALLDACRQLGLQAVTVGAAGGRTDPTQIEISDLGSSGGDDLLRVTRRKLRRSYGWAPGPGHRYGVLAVFSRETPSLPPTCQHIDITTASHPHRIDCSSGIGSVCHLTATFGMAAAAATLQFDSYQKKLW